MAGIVPHVAGRPVSPELQGILLTLLAMGLFGCMDWLSKLLVHGYAAWFVLWIRHLVSLVLVLAFLAPEAPLRTLRTLRRPGLQIARSLLMVVEMGLVLIAFRTLPLADAHAIFAATPLLVTALSVPFLGERVGPKRWFAVLAGFAGVLVILRPGLVAIGPATLLAIVAMAMYGTYHVATRYISRFDPPSASYLAQIVVSTAALTLVGPFFAAPIGWADLPLFVGLGVLGAGGHYCLVKALASAPAVIVQPFTYTLLLWAVMIGYVGFGDLPDMWTLVGAGIVVAAGIYAALQASPRGAA